MGEASRLLATFALNATWQLLAVVAAAAIADLLLRRAAARTRHTLWIAALALAACLPLVATIPGGREAARPPAELPGTPGPLPAASDHAAAGAPARFALALPGGAGLAVLALVLAAAAVRGTRLLLALRRAAAFRRSAQDEPSARIGVLSRECEEALGLRPVPVRTAPGLDGPVTLGVRRPVVLLPSAFADGHDDDAIRAALAHELAHVKRRDFALNLAYETALLPFAWHPAARALRRKLGETREMACDELASERLLGPRRYARSLVAVASGISRTASSPALGVDDAGILEDRVRHLLRPRDGSPGQRRLGIAAGVALLLATSLFASFAVVEARPLPAAPAEWRSQMKNVVGVMILALGLPASGDDLTRGLEALKAGDLVTASASVQKAVAANPKDRDALYALGVIRWQEAYDGLGEAKKDGKVEAAERDRLKKTVTLGHDALGKALAIDPAFVEAIVYESLLLRLDAELAAGSAGAGEYVRKAEQLIAKAKELKASGGASASPKAALPLPPPPPSKKAPPPPPPPAS